MLIRFFMIVTAMFVLIFSHHNPVLASVSMAAPVCSVKGVVISEDTRTEKGQGMSEGQTFKYHDVKVKVIKSEIASAEDKNIFKGHTGCDPKAEMTFQKRKDSSLKGIFKSEPDIVGECIKARTHFSADGNFMSGNWLYDIQVLDMAACRNK